MVDFIKKLNFIKKHKDIIIIILFTIVVLGGAYHYREYLEIMKDPAAFKNFITSFGYFGIVIYLLFQVMQVVIFFIPGEVMYVAGGYAYGTLIATFLSMLGITIGSVFTFILSKKFGRPLVLKMVPEKHINGMEKYLNGKRMNLIVFLLFFLPGIPKDSTVLICGISKLSFKDFVIYSSLGRIPLIAISCFLGSNLISGNKQIIIAMAVIIVVFFIIGILKGEAFLKSITRTSQE